MELTVVTPRFEGAARTGPLTFGQEYMVTAFLAHISLYRDDHATSESLGWNVAAEIAPTPRMHFDAVLASLRSVVAAHEGLRTIFDLSGNGDPQVTADRIHWEYELREGSSREEFDAPGLDLSPNHAPWALTALTDGDRVIAIRFTGHHALFDAFSARVVKEQLELSFDAGASWTASPTGSPLDYANEQRSASWRARRERTERHFVSAGDQPRTGRRLHRSICNVTTDTRVLAVSASELRRTAAVLGLSSSAALHAAATRAASQNLDYPIWLHEIASSNRTRRQTRELLTNLAQFAPLRPATTNDADCELAAARDMHRRHLQAMAHGEYDPRLRIAHLQAWEPDAESFGLPTFLFNHVPLVSHDLAPGAHVQVRDVSYSENAGVFASTYTTEEQDSVIVKLGIVDASGTLDQTRILASMHDALTVFLSALVSGASAEPASSRIWEDRHDGA